MGKTGPMGERTPREGIRVWESIIRESADFTLLIIGNPGALVTFFNYIPGLLFPKKIMQSQSGSITFRRVGFSICVHR